MNRFELIDAAAFLRAAGAPCAHVSLRSPPATLPSAATFGAACFLAHCATWNAIECRKTARPQ